jgi:hypothetical protein
MWPFEPPSQVTRYGARHYTRPFLELRTTLGLTPNAY